MSPPIIHLQSIPDEGMELPLSLESPWLRGALEDTGFAPTQDTVSRVTVRLDRDGRTVIVSGHVAVHLTAECVACLTPVDVHVDTDFSLTLEPRPKGPVKPHEEVELSAHEVDVDYHDDDQIDLGRWLRDAILVEAPAHPRHEGACPVTLRVPPSSVGSVESVESVDAGARDIDPRLLPLLKLSKKE